MLLKKRIETELDNITVGEYNFERVDRFKYVGITITSDNNITEELREFIQNAKAKANLCLYAWHKVFESQGLSRSTK